MSYKERLRKTSFFNTYGPGAVYETSRGHTVIIKTFDLPPDAPILEDGFLKSYIARYLGDQIKDKFSNIGIFLIPDSDEEGNPAFRIKGEKFFKWGLATVTTGGRILTYLVPYNEGENFKNFLKENYGDDVNFRFGPSVRFVGICDNGHLQDLPWERIVHEKKKNGNKKKCSNKFFIWREEKGQTKGGLKITCPLCGAEAGLKDIYNVKAKCQGIRAESGEREPCNRNITVTLKTSSDVYILESIIAVSAHPFATERYRIFIENHQLWIQIKTVYDLESLDEVKKEEEIIKILRQYLGTETLQRLFGNNKKEVWRQIKGDIIPTLTEYFSTAAHQVDENHIKKLEIDTLLRACKEGYPPIEDIRSKYYLIIDKNLQKRKNHLILQPVEKLTFYRIFIGYRRTSPSAVLNPVYAHHGGRLWFAASSHITEGIFITFDEELTETVFGELKNKEIFALLHSLSHAFIRFFGEVSGYSDASLRERIYFFPEEKKAGFLIFALSESSDGAAGGLISSVNSDGNIEKMLDFIRNRAEICSRDPVCLETSVEIQPPPHRNLYGFNKNEAVCHACLFVSETSCEYGNKGLSRKILQKFLNLTEEI